MSQKQKQLANFFTQKGKRYRFKKGQALPFSGQVFLIIKGRVGVYTVKGRKRVLVAEYGKNEVFSLSESFLSTKANFSYWAEVEVQVWGLDKKDFLAFLGDEREVACRLGDLYGSLLNSAARAINKKRDLASGKMLLSLKLHTDHFSLKTS